MKAIKTEDSELFFSLFDVKGASGKVKELIRKDIENTLKAKTISFVTNKIISIGEFKALEKENYSELVKVTKASHVIIIKRKVGVAKFDAEFETILPIYKREFWYISCK